MTGNPEIKFLRNVKLVRQIQLTKRKAPNKELENPQHYLGEREARFRLLSSGNALHLEV